MLGTLGHFSLLKELISFLRWSLPSVNFSCLPLLPKSSEIQKLAFLTCISQFFFPPGLPYPSWVSHTGRISHSILWKCSSLRVSLHTAGSAVSQTPTEPRQRATLALGHGSCVCRNEWLFSLLSFLKGTEVKKVSALTRDMRISAQMRV